MKHIIAVLLENEPGALSRVVGLFSARGYNIESLTVAPTEDPSLSRMTIQTTGSDDVIEQITKHLNRLIEVVKVVDLTEGSYIERELMMVKVRAVGKEREEMKRMADIFRGRIIDVTDKSYTIELTGDQSKNDAFLEALERAAILETVRTGSSGIGRGERRKRQAQLVVEHAEHGHGGLDRDRIGFGEDRANQRLQLEVKRTRRDVVAGLGGPHKRA